MSLLSEPKTNQNTEENVIEKNDILDLLFQPKEDANPKTELQETLAKEVSDETVDFILNQCEVDENSCFGILKTSTAFNVDNFPSCPRSELGYDLIVNLKSINDTLHINNLFTSLNRKLTPRGTFVGCVETYQLRKKRLLKKFPKGLNYIYYFFDYVFKRVFPKIKVLDKVYFFITAGRNRAISDTEALGRLNYCGFEILQTKIDRNLMYFSARKVVEVKNVREKSYRIFLKLPRNGKNGKLIKVYKLRTMFPYAEYVQSYVYKKNNLKEGGKFENDFRISLLGSFFRKYFLDEIPMLINFFKGDLKIVGVRPLSNHYLSLYDSELQEQRTKHKPGLIPPYYVDLPKTLEEIQASEKRYLDAYEKSPYLTDCKYFILAFKNIIFKKARSK